jgi:glycosyltransferase involved in cell wall biosynthesis
MIKGLYHHRTQATDAQGIHINEMYMAFGRLGIRMKMVALVKDEALGQDIRDNFWGKITSNLPSICYEIMEMAYNLIGVFKLYRASVSEQPLFIYERYSIYNIAGCIVSKLTKIPLIEEVNSPLAFEKKKYGNLHFPKLAQTVETWIINQSFKTIAVTHVLKEILVKNGADIEKIEVMPNGVNLQDYPVPLPRRLDQKIVLGFVGWFRDWHGLNELVDIYARHGWDTKKVHLLLIGDGPARKMIEQTIDHHNIQKHVTITGAVDRQQLQIHLEKVDIAVQPAVTEYASPMKLIEYMVTGKAIVAPDQPNIKELLTHKQNAILFKPCDWEDFALQIEKLISNPSLVHQIGVVARNTVKEKSLSWDYNAKQVIRLITL